MLEMSPMECPIVTIIGNTKTSAEAKDAAMDLGRALAKGGFRIMVYSSDPDFLEGPVVAGYAESKVAKPHSIQVRYPLHGHKPGFPEQRTDPRLFDWRPDSRLNWEMSFYTSLQEADGAILLGGGDSTLVAGLVALGQRIAIVALAAFKGRAAEVWEALQPGRDLPSADEISLMARPEWSSELADDCVKSLKNQLDRRQAEIRQRRLDELRQETKMTWHAVLAVVVFLLALGCVPYAWTSDLDLATAICLLFFSPILAGIAGSTVRLVLDLRSGAAPLSRQSVITTAALGLVAGGVAGVLFITAQVNILPSDQIPGQAGKLVPLGVAVGFIAGLTLDAVFRRLMTSNVVDLSAVEMKKRS